jgi:hypothetical protein
MEEEEYNDIVTYIQDQKYPQNAETSYWWIKFLIYLNLHDSWFYNGFEYYSICHLNWHGSVYNIFSVYIYIYL